MSLVFSRPSMLRYRGKQNSLFPGFTRNSLFPAGPVIKCFDISPNSRIVLGVGLALKLAAISRSKT